MKRTLGAEEIDGVQAVVNKEVENIRREEVTKALKKVKTKGQWDQTTFQYRFGSTQVTQV